MKQVKITVLKKSVQPELIEAYGVPGLGACTRLEDGQVFYTDYHIPQGMCEEAWKAMSHYVFALYHSDGDQTLFSGRWVREPGIAIASCNDGLRPVFFKLELLRDGEA